MKKLILSLLIITAVLFSSTAAFSKDSEQETNLRIVSINLSCDMQNISARGSRMVDLLLSYSPDSIGTQENGLVYNGQWPEIFRKGLADYSRVGIGDTDELTKNCLMANYIYYDHTKYDLVDWGSVYLPSLRRLREISWDTNARTVTWAILRNRHTGFTYAHFNTHISFESDEDNRFQMSIVAKMVSQLADIGYPVFASGDYNSSEGSESYRIMMSEPGIGDPKHLADRSESKGTFRGWNYRSLEGGSPIDFIFVSKDMIHVNEYSVIDTYVDGVALSDHCGVFIDVTAGPVPDAYGGPATGLDLSGMVISEVSRRSYVYEFSFTQPENIGNIFRYSIRLSDSRGSTVDSRTVCSYLLDGSCTTERMCTFTGLDPGTGYTVSITGVSIDGKQSQPMEFSFRTREE